MVDETLHSQLPHLSLIRLNGAFEKTGWCGSIIDLFEESLTVR
jgi:hypothetical protein